MPLEPAPAPPPVIGNPVSERLLEIASANPRWTRTAQAALDAFVATLDPISLSAAGLPYPVLGNAPAFKALLAVGVRPVRVFGVGANEHDVRLHALIADAPSAVHALLDAHGVPLTPSAQREARLYDAVRRGRGHSIGHLLDAHPETRAHLGREGIPLTVASEWQSAFSQNKSPRFLVPVARAVSERGADWSSASEKFSAYPWFPNLEAEILGATLPASPRKSARPRM